MNSGIYKIANKTTGNFYIGSSANLKRRFIDHKTRLKNKTHENQILQRAYNKYGIEKLSFNIIEYLENKNNLISREQHYLDTLNPKYNIRKLADSNLGIKRSEETKKKMSDAKKGNKNPMFNKHHSEKIRKEIGLASKGNKHNLGKKASEETKKKMSDAKKGNKYCLGYKHSETTKQKMSEAHKDEKNHFFGKRHTEETKKKTSLARRNQNKI